MARHNKWRHWRQPPLLPRLAEKIKSNGGKRWRPRVAKMAPACHQDGDRVSTRWRPSAAHGEHFFKNLFYFFELRKLSWIQTWVDEFLVRVLVCCVSWRFSGTGFRIVRIELWFFFFKKVLAGFETEKLD